MTFQSDQREFFDQLITEQWDAYSSDEWDAARRFEIKQLFKIVQPKTILDIGCGCGFHDVEMANYPFVEHIDAIDYSPKSIEQANKHYPHNKVTRSVAGFDETTGSWDLIVSFQVFEHIDRQHDYLAHCSKLGGAVAIITPNFDSLDNRLREWRGMGRGFVDPQHYIEHTRSSLIAMGIPHGLKYAGSFSYDCASLMFPAVQKIPHSWRLHLGRLFPSISRVIGVVLTP